MSVPSTPHHRPTRVEVAISPRNQDYLKKTLHHLNDYIHKEKDAEQRSQLVACLEFYVAGLSKIHQAPRSEGDSDTALGSEASTDDPDDDAGDSRPKKAKGKGTQPRIGGRRGARRKGTKLPTISTAHGSEEDPDGPVEKMTLDLSKDADVATVEEARTRFFDRVSALVVTVTKDNKKKKVGFTRKEALEMTNLFFTDLMSMKTIKRLATLIKTYTAEREDDLDAGAAARAEAASRLEGNTENIRAFFDTFARSQRARRSPQSGIAYIHQIQLSMQLLEQYSTLRDLAAAKDQELLTFLRERGYTTRKGVKMPSLILRFLAESLNITPNSLQNTCQTAQGVTALVEHFGPGIIPTLPVGTMTKLNRWGNQRMHRVFTVLREETPFLIPICRQLEESIYDPINTGQPLLIQQITKGPRLSFLARITDADAEEDAVEEDGAGDGGHADGNAGEAEDEMVVA